MTTNSLDALNFDISELADTPEFRLFPDGTHIVNLTLEVKNSKAGQPMVVWKMSAVNTEELGNESDTPLKPGESNTIYFSLANEYGMGALKKAIAPISQALQLSNLKDVVEAIQTVETDGDTFPIVVVTKIKPPRKSKPDEQPSLQLLSVAVA